MYAYVHIYVYIYIYTHDYYVYTYMCIYVYMCMSPSLVQAGDVDVHEEGRHLIITTMIKKKKH